jgi:hypothetical protein
VGVWPIPWNTVTDADVSLDSGGHCTHVTLLCSNVQRYFNEKTNTISWRGSVLPENFPSCLTNSLKYWWEKLLHARVLKWEGRLIHHDRGLGFQLPDKWRGFHFCYSVQTASGAESASYAIGVWNSFGCSKAIRMWLYSLSSGAEKDLIYTAISMSYGCLHSKCHYIILC